MSNMESINIGEETTNEVNKMSRKLSESTQFAESTNSLLDVADAMAMGCGGFPMSPRESDDAEEQDDLDTSKKSDEGNPIGRAFESVGRKLQEWKNEQELRHQRSKERQQSESRGGNSPQKHKIGTTKREKQFIHISAAREMMKRAMDDRRNKREEVERELTMMEMSKRAMDDNRSEGEEVERLLTMSDDQGDHDDVLPQRSESPPGIADEDDFPIQVIHDDETIPRLLSESTMRTLMQAMPHTLHGRAWKRAYSIIRDGDSFDSFLNKVKGHEYTLIVIQTTDGDLVGGLADVAWQKGCGTIDGIFFGTGTSFIFSLAEDSDDDAIQIYRWQGVNEYSQLCRKNDGCVGMGGGGGSFGIFLQENFTRGSSGACNTFGNTAPLTSSPLFEVLNFEVYGFKRHW